MSDINIGLERQARLDVAHSLNGTLADSYQLYLKTHAYHWNVTGPQFTSLHTMFEDQYRELWAALDEIAERVRALGVFAPSSGKTLSQLAEISSIDEEPPEASQMVASLLADNEALIRRARAHLTIAEDAGDSASADLLTVRIKTHEKTAWMLRALLQ